MINNDVIEYKLVLIMYLHYSLAFKRTRPLSPRHETTWSYVVAVTWCGNMRDRMIKYYNNIVLGCLLGLREVYYCSASTKHSINYLPMRRTRIQYCEMALLLL